MIQEELKREAAARRFLLDEMSPDERSAFEERFVADDSFFEQLSIVEDELIESYLRGTLSAIEREKFERGFLTTERRRRRVEFTRTMLDKLIQPKEIAAIKKTEAAGTSPSVWDSVANFFKTPSLAFGAALAILLAVFGGWLLLNRSNQPELTGQTTPTPTPAIKITQSNSNQPDTTNQNGAADSNPKTLEETIINRNDSGQKKEPPDKNSDPQQQSVVTPVLALFTGTVRSGGKTKELSLPENAAQVLLQLNLESQDYKIYRAEIVTADGEIVVKSDRLKAQNSKIKFSVPAKKLRRGDYIVKLSALNPQNEIESVADYFFRVNRK